MSLSEPPIALPMALQSASGRVAVVNTRPVVMPVLNGVSGASFIDALASRPAADPATDCRASVPPRAWAADGNALANFESCPSELEKTEPIILPSVRSASRSRCRLGPGSVTLRGTGVRSSMALASITPPLPSSAAWWILEKNPATIFPSGILIRLKTWNSQSGKSRSINSPCSCAQRWCALASVIGDAPFLARSARRI